MVLDCVNENCEKFEKSTAKECREKFVRIFIKNNSDSSDNNFFVDVEQDRWRSRDRYFPSANNNLYYLSMISRMSLIDFILAGFSREEIDVPLTLINAI